MLKLTATVFVELPVKIPTEACQLTIGALTLTSADGKRAYIVDSQSTNYNNPFDPEDKDDDEGNKNFTLDSKCIVDLNTFPIEENKYNLLEEDLEKGSGLFFCSDQDIEDNCFDYDKVKAYAIIYNLETKKEYTIAVTLER